MIIGSEENIIDNILCSDGSKKSSHWVISFVSGMLVFVFGLCDEYRQTKAAPGIFLSEVAEHACRQYLLRGKIHDTAMVYGKGLSGQCKRERPIRRLPCDIRVFAFVPIFLMAYLPWIIKKRS